jgi:crotonobetainyl-CoA:carnitine CoA-transferase CaiB-like acyl-CoA transferase
VALGALEDKFWFAFCDQIQRPDLKDVGFDIDKNRQAQKEVQMIIGNQKASYWQTWSQKNDVCLTVLSEPKMTAKTVLCDKNKIPLKESDFLNQKRVEKYQKTGADSESILRRIGYTQKKITELKKKGILL